MFGVLKGAEEASDIDGGSYSVSAECNAERMAETYNMDGKESVLDTDGDCEADVIYADDFDIPLLDDRDGDALYVRTEDGMKRLQGDRPFVMEFYRGKKGSEERVMTRIGSVTPDVAIGDIDRDGDLDLVAEWGTDEDSNVRGIGTHLYRYEDGSFSEEPDELPVVRAEEYATLPERPREADIMRLRSMMGEVLSTRHHILDQERYEETLRAIDSLAAEYDDDEFVQEQYERFQKAVFPSEITSIDSLTAGG